MNSNHTRTRSLEVAEHVIDTKCTVRKAAAEFGVSKSTIHLDIVTRLPKYNKELAEKAAAILGYNKAVRHMRGGESTRLKYEKLKREKKGRMNDVQKSN